MSHLLKEFRVNDLFVKHIMKPTGGNGMVKCLTLTHVFQFKRNARNICCHSKLQECQSKNEVRISLVKNHMKSSSSLNNSVACCKSANGVH